MNWITGHWQIKSVMENPFTNGLLRVYFILLLLFIYRLIFFTKSVRFYETSLIYHINIIKYTIKYHMYTIWTSRVYYVNTIKYIIEHHIYAMWTSQNTPENITCSYVNIKRIMVLNITNTLQNITLYTTRTLRSIL